MKAIVNLIGFLFIIAGLWMKIAGLALIVFGLNMQYKNY